MSGQDQFSVAHLTTVDMSLRYLVAPQLRAVLDADGVAIGISAPGPWVSEIEEMGVTHIALPSSTRGVSLWADMLSAYEFWRAIRRVRPTVLHTHNPKPGLYGRILGRLARVPLVVNTVHGLYATPDDPLLKRAVVYLLEGIASRFSDVELYQNIEDLDLARSIGIVSRTKSSLLGNGVDLARFDPDAVPNATRKTMRDELGAGEETVVVGVVGRLVREKGFPELFEAMRGLGDDYLLVVIGPADPDKPDALAPSIVEDAESDGVVFLGMRTDMRELYSAMDVFVLPSHREGFPRAAMEAAAMGLAVVATDIRGCRQVVEDGVNGLLVPVSSPEGLGAAITELGSDRARREAMGRASYERSRTHFDEDEVVRKVMQSYVRGLEAKGRGRLLPSALMHPSGSFDIRPGGPGDVAVLAAMHSEHISTGFLPRLGPRLMRSLYSGLIEWPGGVVLVAEDELGLVGFVSGVVDTAEFYKHFIRRRWWQAGPAALPRILLPSNVKKAWETITYGRDDEDDVAAELLAMSVGERARRRGLGKELGEHFLAALAEKGVAEVKVVVGSANVAAIGAYSTMGFTPHEQIEVHSGEPSEVMVWRS